MAADMPSMVMASKQSMDIANLLDDVPDEPVVDFSRYALCFMFYVLLEKLLPAGRYAAKVSGVLMIISGFLLFLYTSL